MERARKTTMFIEQFYQIYRGLSDSDFLEVFYDFLVNGIHGSKGAMERIANSSDYHIEEIDARREDMMLDIMVNYYKFIRSLRYENLNEPNENDLITFFETKGMQAVDFTNFFCMAENKEKAKEMIHQYCIFMTQGAQFREIVEEFNAENPSEFLGNMNKHIDYVNTCDEIAIIYNLSANEYLSIDPDENDDEHDNDDYEDLMEEDGEELTPYEEMASDVVSEVLEYLTNKYRMADEFEAFVKYYIGLIYACLLVQRSEGLLNDHHKAVLNSIELEDSDANSIMNIFQDTKNFFMGIELVSQEYTDTRGTVFDMRYNFDDPKTGRIFNMLDPAYTYEKEEKQQATFIVIGSVIEKYDEILIHFKHKYPEEYESRLYSFLLGGTEDDGILYEHDIEDPFINIVKLSIIRYLARKFVTATASKEVIELSMEDLFLFNALSFADKSMTNLIKLFNDGGYQFIYAYFEMLEIDDKYEKEIIRNIQDHGKLPLLAQIDQMCIGDDIVYKAINEGSLYTILENEGVEEALKYLRVIEAKVPNQCSKDIGELLLGAYEVISKQETRDNNDEAIVRYIEHPGWTVEEYKNDLLRNEMFLTVLLEKYVTHECSLFSIPMEVDEKVKQKLKVQENLDNQN